MKITAIKYWQVDLPLREGRYSWSNGLATAIDRSWNLGVRVRGPLSP